RTEVGHQHGGVGTGQHAREISDPYAGEGAGIRVVGASGHAGCGAPAGKGTRTDSSGGYCWQPKTSLSPWPPLAASRFRVNLMANAGSNSTKSVMRSSLTPKSSHTVCRVRVLLRRTWS